MRLRGRINMPNLFASLLDIGLLAMLSVGSASDAQSGLRTPQAALIRVMQPGETDAPSWFGPGADYRFGSIDPLEVATFEHVFRFTNVGQTALTLTSYIPSCHCTSLKVIGRDGAPEAFPVTIQPGAKISFQVDVNIADTQPGILEKSVKLVAAAGGAESTLITLVVEGSEAPDVTFSPSYVNFGQLKFGSAGILPLIVTLPANVVAAGATLQLASTDPYVLLSPNVDGQGAVQTLVIKPTASATALSIQVASAAALAGHNGFLTAKILRGTQAPSDGAWSAAPIVGMENFHATVVPPATGAMSTN